MHQYFRAVGFSNLKSLHQLDQVQKELRHNPDRRIVVSRSLFTSLVQLDKEYGDGIGISVIGEMNAEGFVNYLKENSKVWQKTEDKSSSTGGGRESCTGYRRPRVEQCTGSV